MPKKASLLLVFLLFSVLFALKRFLYQQEWVQ